MLLRLPLRLAALLAAALTLGTGGLHAQNSEVPAEAPAEAPPAFARPAPETRSDNYYDLRARFTERLEREEEERETGKRQGDVLYEDQDEMAFERWDRYWRDHLDARSHQPGKMADMSRSLRSYYMAGRTGAKSTALVCPSAGLGDWASLGPSTFPAPIIGKVGSVYIDPAHPNTVYAGASEGGLFKTVNSGASWTNLTDASHYPALGVTSIAVHPTLPTTIYIATRTGPPGGTSYGFGILKSKNGGTTWEEIFTLATFNNQSNYNVAEGSQVSKIMLHPQHPDTLYAAAAHYVFRSTDAGVHWEKVMEITPPNPNPNGCGYPVVDLDIIPGASGVTDSYIAVSTQRNAWSGIPFSPCGPARSFLSAAGGASGTFVEITSAVVGSDPVNRIAAAVQPGNRAELFLAYSNMSTSLFNLKKYNLASHTVSLVGTINTNGGFQLGAGYWDLEIDFSKLNPNTLYVAGTTAYRVSLANGFSSAQISSYWATDPNTCVPVAQTHADIRAMMVGKNGTKDMLVLGSDGGIHKAVLNPTTAYTPTTASWDDLSGPGLAINELYDINGIQSNPDVLVGGTQDNGTLQYDNGIWAQRFNYDGWQGTINQETGEYFGMTNAGPIKGMTGTVGTFGYASAPGIGAGPVVSDPNHPAVLYGGAASLYKSTNFSASAWTTLPLPAGTSNVRAIHVAPSDSNVLYVSRNGPTWDPSNLANRLFRSGDGGLTWKDVGTNLAPLAWATVSDIAVDPEDADRVWVSFNGYWSTSNTSTNGANRVYYSANGGGTWNDFTYNLLAFPVASLIYQRGSADVLYAATDVGIFRYNKSLQAWECFNNMLPIVPVTRLEINYGKNKIRAATAGRGAYESDLPLLPGKVVNASATWSGVRYLANDLTIAPGVTLTLTGTLSMSQDTRIIVQRGATLDVNGGKITNAVGDMWFGIEVWGTASAPQSLPGAQGKVIVRNGATIENAVEAITTGKDVNTTFDWSYTGGIVLASNSYFYNNRRSVQFMYYHSMKGSKEISNQSYFTNCTFETNRLLNDPTRLPYAHISLYEVKDVDVLGCKLSNTAAASVFGVNDRGDGVVSYDAQYTVDDSFNFMVFPPLVRASSVFSGLTYGVRADFTAGVNKKVTISDSDFINVQRGVQITNSNGSSVGANNFNPLPNALTTNFANATWGVRMNEASSLSVTGNTVTGASAAFKNNYGFIIDNCGSSAGNVVQGNTLKNLNTGIQALGGNGSGANGVRFRCNVFQPSMAYQLAVTGKLADQGTTCALGSTADNTFFVQATPAGSQINSPGTPFIYYASGTVPTNIGGPVTVTSCAAVAGECKSGGPPFF